MTCATFLLSLSRETDKHPSGLKTERFAASTPCKKEHLWVLLLPAKVFKIQPTQDRKSIYRRRLSNT